MKEKLPPLKKPQDQVKVLSMVRSGQLLNFFIGFFIVKLVKNNACSETPEMF